MTESKLVQMEKDEYWMLHALRLAQKGAAQGEVPVGAVLVEGDRQIAQAYNRPISLHDATAHAEILCIREAGKISSNYRLKGCTLYVTLEPCAMCVGALIHARIERLVFAAHEPKAGCISSQLNLAQSGFFNHQFSVTSGILAEQASRLLSDFFAQRRQQKMTKNNQHENMNRFDKNKEQQDKDVASPCVSVCALNSDDICMGCYRSCDEIRDWNSLDNQGKKAVLQRANKRCKEIWG